MQISSQNNCRCCQNASYLKNFVSLCVDWFINFEHMQSALSALWKNPKATHTYNYFTKLKYAPYVFVLNFLGYTACIHVCTCSIQSLMHIHNEKLCLITWSVTKNAYSFREIKYTTSYRHEQLLKCVHSKKKYSIQLFLSEK